MVVEGNFKLAHQIGAYTFLGLLTVHICAALMHHFLLRDEVLRRMWFQRPAVQTGVAARPGTAGGLQTE
jgi:cytochrome b561